MLVSSYKTIVSNHGCKVTNTVSTELACYDAADEENSPFRSQLRDSIWLYLVHRQNRLNTSHLPKKWKRAHRKIRRDVGKSWFNSKSSTLMLSKKVLWQWKATTWEGNCLPCFLEGNHCRPSTLGLAIVCFLCNTFWKWYVVKCMCFIIVLHAIGTDIQSKCKTDTKKFCTPKKTMED
jgi:hypothetical protein